MNLTTFFMIYAKKAIKEQCIPFALTAKADKFYSKSNMKALEKATLQYHNGQVVTKSIEELEAMANG